MDGFQVIIPGLQTSIQDLGFHGYLGRGVCVSGAMDAEALMIANILVGNPRSAAGLEITAIGPTLQFLSDTIIAITGAEFQISLDNKTVPMCTAIPVKSGQVLSFGAKLHGIRSYIAFAGGLDVPEFCGSKSTILKAELGGFGGRALKKDDVVSFVSSKTSLPNLENRSVAYVPVNDTSICLRYIPGPQDYLFPQEAFAALESETGFAVTEKNNRQGYRLDGPEVKPYKDVNIVSDGAAVGALQISPSFKPFLLLAETSPAGGYAKIGTVITVDLPQVAQVTTGAIIRFTSVTVDEAQKLLRERHEKLDALETRLNTALNASFSVHYNGREYAVSLQEVFLQ